MAKLNVKDLEGNDVGSIDVADEVFAAEVKEHLLWEVVRWQRAKARAGTAKVKERSEVHGTHAKMFKQKGTGNARHGDKRAPIFVGGGVVFGPRPRDYSKKVTRGVRKLALRRVLGDLVRDASIHTVESFSIEDGKTKTFVSTIDSLVPAGKVLVIANSFDEKTYLAARNVFWAQLATASDVNVEQLILADSVLLVGDAINTLAQRTA
jgi:large subunit ribosomal protein L4